MPESLRPRDYLEYRDTAAAILGRSRGMDAVSAFGLDELLSAREETPDLGPAYAFLEAQGSRAAVTPALALLGLVGCQPADREPLLLGSPLGGTRLVGVPGMSDGAAVAVDRLGAGLVVLADPAAAIRPPTPPVADDYVTVLDIEAADGTTLLTEEEMNGRRAAVLARTQLGAAAEMLGVVDRLLDDAVAYAQQRRQFGRTVASYQSMQHLLAWAATERHQLISLYDLAVVRSTRGPVDALLSAAVKAMAGRVLHAVAQTAIQVTGGISFTWEYGLNRLHRRGLVLDQLAGSSADLLVALGRQVRTEGVVPELVDLCDVAD